MRQQHLAALKDSDHNSMISYWLFKEVQSTLFVACLLIAHIFLSQQLIQNAMTRECALKSLLFCLPGVRWIWWAHRNPKWAPTWDLGPFWDEGQTDLGDGLECNLQGRPCRRRLLLAIRKKEMGPWTLLGSILFGTHSAPFAARFYMGL